MLCNKQLNPCDKNGLAPAFGFSDNINAATSCQGHYINYNAFNGLTFSYAIPIIGILGSGCEKFIPIGDFYSLRYELTMDAYGNFTIPLVQTAAGLVTGCTISEVEFCGQVVELDATPQSMIEQANPDKIYIRANSYRTATNYLPAQSNGLNDVLIGTRVSSLKSLYMTCAPANGLEKTFGSVCANLTQGTCFVLAGQNLPQRTLNPINHPADTYLELQKAMNALSTAHFNGSINKTGYYTSSTAQGLMTAYSTAVTASTTSTGAGSAVVPALANIWTAPNMFVLAVNAETVAHRGGLLSGININSAPSFFRAQINAALANQSHTLYFFAYHDVILEIDRNAKTIVANF